MTSKKKIATALIQVLTQEIAMSNNLYAEELADFEAELKASLDKDADDALLCMLADQGDVAMMLIDGGGNLSERGSIGAAQANVGCSLRCQYADSGAFIERPYQRWRWALQVSSG